MLRRIRQLLETRRLMSLCDLALQLDAQPDAIEKMMEVWIRKGRIRRVEPDTAPACGGCAVRQSCNRAESVLYEWIA